MSIKRRQFTREFKPEIVQEIAAGKSQGQLARQHRVNQTLYLAGIRNIENTKIRRPRIFASGIAQSGFPFCAVPDGKSLTIPRINRRAIL